ncbi:hypothetical protein ONZ45_g4545 [Pleurotus djamor]|nr:hypothetical protein ONZ45_g4545 [Pleurotus djamor]
MRYSKSFLPFAALFGAMSSIASPTQEQQLEERQISLNPASSCPSGQLWCCKTIGLDGTLAGLLVALHLVDPTGLNTLGTDCTALSFPFNMRCPSPGTHVCCDKDILPLVSDFLKFDCRSVNPLL